MEIKGGKKKKRRKRTQSEKYTPRQMPGGWNGTCSFYRQASHSVSKEGTSPGQPRVIRPARDVLTEEKAGAGPGMRALLPISSLL